MTTNAPETAADHRSPTASVPTVSTAVAEVLAERTDHLFGLMGNGNAHLISHLTYAGFGFTSARHEAATVAMADAYHRATGKVGAATTTYGAGFTNTSWATLALQNGSRAALAMIVLRQSSTTFTSTPSAVTIAYPLGSWPWQPSQLPLGLK